MSTKEPETPVRIGAGSFAVVYVLSGGLVAFKEVLHTDSSAELRREYGTLRNVYIQCNTDSFFSIPRPFAFFNPLTGDFFTDVPSSPSITWPHRTTLPFVTADMGACFQKPTYAMDRVPALPTTVRRHLAERYFPRNVSPGPALCRLYFGKDHTGAAPSRFFNTNNFPLDETRYTQLATLFEYLPPAADVARAMGDMLFRLHHLASVDARDVEFVLGGDDEAGFTFFVIDFNQVGAAVKSFLTFFNLPHLRCGYGTSVWNPSTNSFQLSSRTTHTTLAPVSPAPSTATSRPVTWIIADVIVWFLPLPSSMPSN